MTDAPMPTPTARAPQLLAPDQRSLPELTAEIQKAHCEVIGALAYGAAAAIRAGHALMAAKALLKKQRGHGLWQDYVAIECRLGTRTAQIYMYLAKHENKLKQLLAAKAQTNSFLSQGEALKLLSVARKKRRRPATIRATTQPNLDRKGPT
jgi:hypothetical protein